MNTKQLSQCCVYCGKGYKTRVNLGKHIILCELLHKRTKTNLNDDDDDIPSTKKMYQMLLELGQKYSKLEEKMDEVNKWVIKKKKKINVLEWLNNNITPVFVFDNLIDKIKVIDSDIVFLLENTFLDTMNLILSRFIYNNENSDFIPLFAFIQKTNIFYAFDKVIGGGWIELPKDRLMWFFMEVQMKVSKAFCAWKKQWVNKIRDDDNFAILCDKTLIKIMGNEFKSDNTFNKMRANVYNKMKTDMKAVLEYEFEF